MTYRETTALIGMLPRNHPLRRALTAVHQASHLSPHVCQCPECKQVRSDRIRWLLPRLLLPWSGETPSA